MAYEPRLCSNCDTVLAVPFWRPLLTLAEASCAHARRPTPVCLLLGSLRGSSDLSGTSLIWTCPSTSPLSEPGPLSGALSALISQQLDLTIPLDCAHPKPRSSFPCSSWGVLFCGLSQQFLFSCERTNRSLVIVL